MIRSRGSHLRLRIVALLAAMAALWAFAAYVTVRDGVDVLIVQTLDRHIDRPTDRLVDALQQERRASVLALAEPDGRDRLGDLRAATDAAAADWREHVAGRGVRAAADDDLFDRIDRTRARLDELPALRERIDEREPHRGEVVDGFTVMIEAGLDTSAVSAGRHDGRTARQAGALVSLARARELLARQDALLAGALASGTVTRAESAEFSLLVGGQRRLHAEAADQLAVEDRSLYRRTVEGAAVTDLRSLQDRVVARAAPESAVPFPRQEWQDAFDRAGTALRELEHAATDRFRERVGATTVGVVLRLVLVGGLGLVAVIAAVVGTVTTARSLTRRLERVRDTARELAEDRLPRVTAGLRAGEPVDVDTEVPPPESGDDAVGQVSRALHTVHSTAVRAAVEQAELRRGVRDVFLSLARRTQRLVHKQLSVVDAMERRQADPDELEELYRIDHLATRMRRNAENLIVLAGATPGRSWRRPVPLIDVIRGAIAEVDDYQRVTVMPVQPAALAGRVTGDVIHLLAELMENAASFSPPYALVGVGGQRVAHGYVVEIEDRGLGISADELESVNERLADPPGFDLADAARLGHYVVANLAQRHGIRVRLRTSPYGGITAVVLLPPDILVDVETGSGPAGPVTGVGTPAGGGGSGGADGRTGRLAVVPSPDRPTVLPARTGRPAPGAGGGHVPASPAAPPVADPSAGGTDPARSGTAADGAPPRTPTGPSGRLRPVSPSEPPGEGPGGTAPRDPDRVLRAMRSYQLGTRRGRADAAGGPATPTQLPPGSRPGDEEG